MPDDCQRLAGLDGQEIFSSTGPSSPPYEKLTLRNSTSPRNVSQVIAPLSTSSGFVDNREQAVGACDSSLQRRIHVRNPAHRLQHQHHGAEEGNELTGRQRALDRLAACHVNDQRDAQSENRLRDRDTSERTRISLRFCLRLRSSTSFSRSLS